MSTELIAETEGKEGIEGSGVVGDVFMLGRDLFSDTGGWDALIDEGLCAVDLLSSAANPLGGLISAGVGWLLEHLPYISDIWDKLMGNAAAINQVSATWDNIAHSLSTSQSTFDGASSEIEQWTGPASESYRKVAQAYSASLGGASTEAEALSIVTQLLGGVASGLKDMVYDMISEFIEFTVLPAILSALATSWCTFGGSIAAAITFIEIEADVTGVQIGEKVTATTVTFYRVSERTAKVVEKLQKLEDALKELHKTLEHNKTLSKTLLQKGLNLAHGQLDAGPATRGRAKEPEGEDGGEGNSEGGGE